MPTAFSDTNFFPFFIQLPALALVKEPRAFRKLCHKQELQAEGRAGNEEGGTEQGEPQATIVGTELDFIPLELNSGAVMVLCDKH